MSHRILIIIIPFDVFMLLNFTVNFILLNFACNHYCKSEQKKMAKWQLAKDA